MKTPFFLRYTNTPGTDALSQVPLIKREPEWEGPPLKKTIWQGAMVSERSDGTVQFTGIPVWDGQDEEIESHINIHIKE